VGFGVKQTSQAITPIVPLYSPRDGQQTAHLETTPPTQIRGAGLAAENTSIERRPIVRGEKQIALKNMGEVQFHPA
jgi:hypothetical protein